MSDLDAAGADQRTGAVRRRVAVTHLSGLDGPVGDEVAAGHQTHHVFAGLVRTGDPCRAVDHPRIDQIANPVGQQCFRADVTLLQEGVLREVRIVEQCVIGGLEGGAQSLVVDLAVTGQADRQQLPVAAGGADLEHHVLQRVGCRDGATQPRRVRPIDERCDGRGVTGVVHGGLWQAVERQRIGDGGPDSFHVGGVAGLLATHEGVLPDLAGGQELLGRAAAHCTGDRRDDHVADRHPVEHLLVRVAVSEVYRAQPVVVDVERIRVLHDELAPAQDARTRPGLVAILCLDLEQQQREVLVGAVLPLDGEGEQLLVGRPQQVVVHPAVLEPEHPVAVLGPAVGGLVRRARQQRREQDLLTADGHHLLAHDRLDAAQHPQPQRQPAVQTRCDRSHVAGPDQQFVAGDFGVGWVVAQGPQEQLGHPGDHSGQPNHPAAVLLRARPGQPITARRPRRPRGCAVRWRSDWPRSR